MYINLGQNALSLLTALLNIGLQLALALVYVIRHKSGIEYVTRWKVQNEPAMYRMHSLLTLGLEIF